MEDYSSTKIHNEISYNGFLSFIDLAKQMNYKFIFFNESRDNQKYIILRHDIDFGIIKDVYELAKIEKKYDIKSTYFFMMRNPFYNMLEKKNFNMVNQIINMGHSIGLHFDVSFYNNRDKDSIINNIEKEIDLFFRIFDYKIYYVSFHKPLSYLIKQDFSIDKKFESVYNRKYFKDIKYMSDSCGRWRGPSIIELLKQNKYNKIQLLTHPGLWMENKGVLLKDRINNLVKKRSDDLLSEMRNTVNDDERKIVLV